MVGFVSADPVAVTVQEAERLSGLGHTFISEAIARREFRSTLVGGRRLVDFADFKRWLFSRSGELKPKPGPAPKPAPEVLPVPAALDDLIAALEVNYGVAWRETADLSDVRLASGKGPLLDALRRRRIARR
jgi:hypothetical protein